MPPAVECHGVSKEFASATFAAAEGPYPGCRSPSPARCATVLLEAPRGGPRATIFESASTDPEACRLIRGGAVPSPEPELIEPAA
jgi:hypothetical protein